MDRRRQARSGFKEEPVFDEELADNEDDEGDEDYNVNSLLNMRPGEYGYGGTSGPYGGDEGGSSSGWVPVPQHRLPPRTPQPLSICQVENCIADMSNAKQYHRRHKVCEFHAKAQVAIVAGLQQRFCQQCSRFHLVSEFDESKRSCRRRLAGHNQRRRKSSYDYPTG